MNYQLWAMQLPLHYKLSSGFYQLKILLKKSAKIKIGKLGTFNFPAGIYIYTGSAKKNLQQRINRHQQKNKKLYWHIDYLLQQAEVVSVKTFPLKNNFTECELNFLSAEKSKLKEPFLIKGFGSSDCRCKSHLFMVKGIK